MDTLGYRFQNSNFSHANIVAQEDTLGGQDQNKNAGTGDFRITQSQFQILSDFLKNVSVSNSQAQVNQVGSISADPQDQNFVVTSNLNRFQNFIFNKHAWILDFGATDLVCFDISNFTSYNPIKPIIIKLSNGNFVIASYSGTVFFNNKFVLKNVLYVSNFSFNLISISRLTTSLKCEFIFSSAECLIQNSITKDKICIVDVVAGLYVFNKADRNVLSCTTKQTNIWHLRMGHPSEERLKVLQTYYPNIHIDKDFICDACHQAKQRKLSFFLGDTRTA